MTLEVINLGKLLRICGAENSQLISLLRSDIRANIAKARGQPDGGMDFHVPFWSDAKQHVAGAGELTQLAALRVIGSKQRKRLYPSLANGFLEWWRDMQRGTNMAITLSEDSVHNHVDLEDLRITLKVDNTMALHIGGDRRLIIYPYFSDKPILSSDWAQIGLRLMHRALPDHEIENMLILDVLRGQAFEHQEDKPDSFYTGKLLRKVEDIFQIYENLKLQYPLAA